MGAVEAEVAMVVEEEAMEGVEDAGGVEGQAEVGVVGMGADAVVVAAAADFGKASRNGLSL